MADTPRRTTPRPTFSSISAQLFVANIKSSCDFYTNKLGFAVEFIYGDPPFYGQVFRDNARLDLRLVFEPVSVGDVREREHLLSASITVGTANEIKQLFLSYQVAGVSFHQTLKKEPWGARTFIVSDPDVGSGPPRWASVLDGLQAIRNQSTCLIDAPSEVKESPLRTNFTERVYIDCSDRMEAGSNCPDALPVASFSRATPRKTYSYQDFFSFFLFSMFLK